MTKHSHHQLQYQDIGRGHVILFLHGFSLDHRMWQPQIDFFSPDYRIIVPDLRGFGQSPLPNGTYSHHQDVKDLLDDLDIAQTHLVGLSLGGEVAIDFAISFPNRVKSLTLLSTSLGGFESTVDWDVNAKEEGVEKAKQNWLNHPVFNSLKATPQAHQTATTIINDYSGWHWFNKDPRKKLRPPAIDQLHTLKIPTQILVGAKDLDYYYQIATVIQKKTNAKVARIKNSGHLLNLEKPKDINQLVRKYITS